MSDVTIKDGVITITVPMDGKMEAVVLAAKRVCNLRYSDAEWDNLDAAIGELISALQDFGVKFDNPRIG